MKTVTVSTRWLRALLREIDGGSRAKARDMVIRKLKQPQVRRRPSLSVVNGPVLE